MKTVEMTTLRLPFIDWAKQNLPPSLLMRSVPVGYGRNYYIAGKGTKIWDRMVNKPEDWAIALIDQTSIKLFHPSYYSDMEDLIGKYETRSSDEITLYYWNEATA